MPGDAFWAALRELMPLHDCGRRLEPGGTENRQLLVCPPCSHVEAVDPVWATVQVNTALLAVSGGDDPEAGDRG